MAMNSPQPPLKSFLLAYWKWISSAVAVLTGIILVVFSDEVRSYFTDAGTLLQGATFKARFGLLLYFGLAVAVVLLFVGLFRHGIPHYFSSSKLTLSIREGAKRLRKHISKCLRIAQPKQKWVGIPNWRRGVVWQELAAAFVDAYSEESTNQRDQGVENRRLLLSNFQVYAKCVASLLKSIEGTEATVWTFLRRPLPAWYNLFPVILSTHPEKRGVFTTRWWENYKEDIKRLRDSQASQIKLKRLVALPPEASHNLACYMSLPEAEREKVVLESYCVLNRVEGAFDLGAGKPPKPTNGVKLLDEVEALRDADQNMIPLRAKLHFVGKHNGNVLPDNWVEIVEHFQREFHTGSGAHACAEMPHVGGVYYKYLKTVPQMFARFDDIFLVESSGMMFGIALCVEEDLDTAGILILESDQLEAFKATFQTEWQQGSNSLSLKDHENNLLYFVS